MKFMRIPKNLFHLLLRTTVFIAPGLAPPLLRLVGINRHCYLSAARTMRLTKNLGFTLAEGELRGFRFEGLLIDEIYPLLHDQMEPVSSALMAKLNLQGETVLDIGASYGYYALMFSRLVGINGAVYAFEPDLNSLLRLAHNLTINNITNTTVLPYAVSDVSRVAQWLIDPTEPWMGHIIDENETKPAPTHFSQPVVTIPLDSLEDAIPFTKIALVKIDVEGKEADVLRGANTLFTEARPVALIELHSEAVTAQVFELLGKYNYQWQTVEYKDATRHHILTFPVEKRQKYEELLAQFFSEQSLIVSL